jgi:hypothetical protein
MAFEIVEPSTGAGVPSRKKYIIGIESSDNTNSSAPLQRKSSFTALL